MEQSKEKFNFTEIIEEKMFKHSVTVEETKNLMQLLKEKITLNMDECEKPRENINKILVNNEYLLTLSNVIFNHLEESIQEISCISEFTINSRD